MASEERKRRIRRWVIGLVMFVLCAFGGAKLLQVAGKNIAENSAFANKVQTATVQGLLRVNESGTQFSYLIFVEGLGFRTLNAHINLQSPLNDGDRVQVICATDNYIWCAAVKPRTE